MASTLTQRINAFENELINEWDPIGLNGIRAFGSSLVYRSVHLPYEVLKIASIAFDVFLGLRAVPCAVLNFGLNRHLYKGVTTQLKQGEWLIPTAVLIIAKLFKPSIDFQSISKEEALRDSASGWNFAKRIRKWGKDQSKKMLENSHGFNQYVTARGVFLISHLILSPICRTIQIVTGTILISASLFQGEETFKKGLITLNAGGICNDLFKGCMRLIYPGAPSNLPVRPQEAIVAEVFESLSKEQVEISTKYRKIFEHMSNAVKKENNIADMPGRIQSVFRHLLADIDDNGDHPNVADIDAKMKSTLEGK